MDFSPLDSSSVLGDKIEILMLSPYSHVNKGTGSKHFFKLVGQGLFKPRVKGANENSG